MFGTPGPPALNQPLERIHWFLPLEALPGITSPKTGTDLEAT